MTFEHELLIFAVVLLAWLLLTPLRVALTADTPRVPFSNVATETREFLVGAARVLFKGGVAGLDPGGYAKAFEPGDRFAGLVEDYVDNSSGAAGAVRVKVHTSGDWKLPISGVAVKDAGKPVFATDDGTFAFTGHPDAFVGYLLHYDSTGYGIVRLKRPFEEPPNGQGSLTLRMSGGKYFDATGGAATTEKFHPDGFYLYGNLGVGVAPLSAENGGLKLAFDAVAEDAQADAATLGLFPVDKGITVRGLICMADKGDHAAVDFDFGLGTPLTSNTLGDVDHADMVQLACFHMDGNSDNILFQSDDNTTDVAPVDTGVDNDSTTDVPKVWQVVVRPAGTVEAWIDGVRVLATTSFALSASAVVAALAVLEKYYATPNDTTAVVNIYDWEIKGGCQAA